MTPLFVYCVFLWKFSTQSLKAAVNFCNSKIKDILFLLQGLLIVCLFVSVVEYLSIRRFSIWPHYLWQIQLKQKTPYLSFIFCTLKLGCSIIWCIDRHTYMHALDFSQTNTRKPGAACLQPAVVALIVEEVYSWSERSEYNRVLKSMYMYPHFGLKLDRINMEGL